MNKNHLNIAFFCLPETLLVSEGIVRSGSIIANEQLISFLEKSGHRVHRIAPKSQERMNLRSIVGIGNMAMFQEVVNRMDEINKCDVVITTNYFGTILPEIKRPLITIFHHSAKSIIDICNQQEISAKRDKLFRKWQKKLCFVDHKDVQEEILHDQMVAITEQKLIDLSEAIVAVSKNLATEIEKNYIINKANLHTIHNSLPTITQFDLAKKKYNQINLSCVTRLPVSESGFFAKGGDRIFEVMGRLRTKVPKIDLTISTDGKKYEPFIKKYLAGINLNCNLPHDLVIKQFESSNVSFHASRLESFGLTLVESMAMANIPIAFNAGVSGELIKDGKNGFIVNNVNQVPKIIHRLSKNEKKMKIMGLAAKETVESILETRRVFGEFEKLLYKVIVQ